MITIPIKDYNKLMLENGQATASFTDEEVAALIGTLNATLQAHAPGIGESVMQELGKMREFKVRIKEITSRHLDTATAIHRNVTDIIMRR
jgi:hypothetical protein